MHTAEGDYEVDAIVHATGFDAMTGTLSGMGITGRDGLRLQDEWAEGPRNYLCLTTSGLGGISGISTSALVMYRAHRDYIGADPP